MKPDLAWFALLATAACGTVTPGDNVAEDTSIEEAPDAPTPDAPLPDTPAPEADFRFFLSLDNGVLMNNNVFATADDVYLNASGTANLEAGEYYFSVDYEVCPPNISQDLYFPTSLPVACRTFTVDASGLITAGAAVAEAEGQACTHVNGIDAVTGGLTIGIAPFEIHRYTCSAMRVRVRPLGAGLSDATVLFFDLAPPPPDDCN